MHKPRWQTRTPGVFTFVAERQLGRESRDSPKESSLTKPKEGGKKLQNKGRFEKVLHSITDTSAEITPRELLRAQPFDIQFEDSIMISIQF